MNCEFYRQGSECQFARRVYGTRDSELSDDEQDYIAEFCTLAEGIGCRDKEGLLNKLSSIKA